MIFLLKSFLTLQLDSSLNLILNRMVLHYKQWFQKRRTVYKFYALQNKIKSFKCIWKTWNKGFTNKFLRMLGISGTRFQSTIASMMRLPSTDNLYSTNKLHLMQLSEWSKVSKAEWILTPWLANISINSWLDLLWAGCQC